MMRIATEVWTMTVIVDIVQITITTIDTVTTMNQMIGKNSNITLIPQHYYKYNFLST